jgi:hypothetical protein
LPLLLAGCVADRFTFEQGSDRCAVRLDGQPFAAFQYRGLPNPALYPLLAPGGIRVSRRLASEPGAEPIADHPHHRSLWFAHGSVNGHDYWQGDGRIEVVSLESRPGEQGQIRAHCQWRVDGSSGPPVCDEDRALRFRAGDDFRAIDLDSTLHAGAVPLVFGDTKEGLMAVRMRNEFCLVGEGAAGSVVNSEGVTGAAAWGKRARWVVYTAKVEGQVLAIGMFDHPQNHGHPTFWHARDYGLLAANPFGVHDFSGAPKGAGDLTVPAGQSLRLRYCVYIHRGAVTPAEIEAAYAAWLAN